MNCTASRLCAPPSGVPAPPMLVPQAIAMSSAEPNALFPSSSMPMKRSIAITIGHHGRRDDGVGQDRAQHGRDRKPHDDLLPRAGAEPSSDTSAMRRSSPHRRQSVARMFAPKHQE